MFDFFRMLTGRSRWTGWWLVMALLVAPALGRMHDVVHVPNGGAVTAHEAHAHTDTTTPSLNVPAWFDGHDALQCLVLDQLVHAHCQLPMAHALGTALPQLPPLWAVLPWVGLHTDRLYLARAPPENFLV